MDFDYDLFVIGAGSVACVQPNICLLWRSSRGSRIHVFRRHCVNVGCVQKKLFVYGSHFTEDFEDASAYGWQVSQGKFRLGYIKR